MRRSSRSTGFLPALLGLAALVVSSSTGFAEATVTAPAPVARPALELKKVISFPLDGDSVPASSEELAKKITVALGRRVDLPAGAKPVRTAGDAYPMLDQLTVDFTDSAINSGRRVPRLVPHGRVEQVIHAQQFSMVADPMKIDGAAMHLRIAAQDVELCFQRDQTNHPLLVVTGAKHGEMQFHTTATDLGRMFQASADLRLRSSLLLLPIELHFTAKVDVKDDGEAHISNLTCDGADAAGWLVSGFIKPALKKYNGQTMPLVQFPSDNFKLHNVKVNIEGDAIDVAAAFGA
jgi:hypothetical protein